MTQQAKERTVESIKGKTIDSMEWQPPEGGCDGYWVIAFTDGSEISFNRMMAEIA